MVECQLAISINIWHASCWKEIVVPTELLDVQKATVLDPTLVKMRAKVREAIALMADPYLSVCELRHEVSFSLFFSLSLSLSRYMSLSLSFFLSRILCALGVFRWACGRWQRTHLQLLGFQLIASMGEAGSLGIKWLRRNTLVMENCQRHALVSHQTPI